MVGIDVHAETANIHRYRTVAAVVVLVVVIITGARADMHTVRVIGLVVVVIIDVNVVALNMQVKTRRMN
jgi:hypothetical protein